MRLREFARPTLHEALALHESVSPLVYHGTSRAFAELDPARGQLGIHFTSDKATALKFAREDGRVFVAHIDVRNPIHLPDMKLWRPAEVVEEIKMQRWDGHVAFPDEMLAALNKTRSSTKKPWEMWHEMRDIFLHYGFDGIVYENTFEGGGTSWIVFQKEQIQVVEVVPAGKPLHEATDNKRIFEAFWWVQRWISGSLDDPDWDDSWTTMGLDEAFHLVHQLVGNQHSAALPLLWRYLVLSQAAARKLAKSKILRPHKRSFQSFTTSAKLARQEGEWIHGSKHKQPGMVAVVVGVKVPPEMIMFGMRDLKASRLSAAQEAVMTTEDWHHQDEVVVRISAPLQVEQVLVVET